MQVFTKYIAKTIVAHLLLITFVCPFFNGKRVDVYNPDNSFLIFLSKGCPRPQKKLFRTNGQEFPPCCYYDPETDCNRDNVQFVWLSKRQLKADVN